MSNFAIVWYEEEPRGVAGLAKQAHIRFRLRRMRSGLNKGEYALEVCRFHRFLKRRFMLCEADWVKDKFKEL